MKKLGVQLYSIRNLMKDADSAAEAFRVRLERI